MRRVIIDYSSYFLYFCKNTYYMVKYIKEDTSVVFNEIPDEVTLAVNISNCQHKCKGCHSPYLREDIGEELNFKVIDELIEKNDGITCFCFMGVGNDLESLKDDVLYIKDKYPYLKVGIYSGADPKQVYKVDEFFNMKLDYLKLGEYIEERGPLNKKTTNQVLFKIQNFKYGRCFETITHKFWGKNL